MATNSGEPPMAPETETGSLRAAAARAMRVEADRRALERGDLRPAVEQQGSVSETHRQLVAAIRAQAQRLTEYADAIERHFG